MKTVTDADPELTKIRTELETQCESFLSTFNEDSKPIDTLRAIQPILDGFLKLERVFIHDLLDKQTTLSESNKEKMKKGVVIPLITITVETPVTPAYLNIGLMPDSIGVAEIVATALIDSGKSIEGKTLGIASHPQVITLEQLKERLSVPPVMLVKSIQQRLFRSDAVAVATQAPAMA